MSQRAQTAGWLEDAKDELSKIKRPKEALHSLRPGKPPRLGGAKHVPFYVCRRGSVKRRTHPDPSDSCQGSGRMPLLGPHWRSYRRGAQASPNTPIAADRSIFAGAFKTTELVFILYFPPPCFSLEDRYPWLGQMASMIN